MKALIDLAVAVAEKEENSNMSPVVQKAMEKHRQEREEAASNDIVELLRMMEGFKAQARKDIKRARVEMNRLKGRLDEVDRRWAYAESTANFLPVLQFFNKVVACDLTNPEDFDQLTSVPRDWKSGGEDTGEQ